MGRSSRKKVLIIRRHKRRRNEGKTKPVQPELMKNPQLSVLLMEQQVEINANLIEMVER